MRTTWNQVAAQVRRTLKDEAGAVIPDETLQATIADAMRELATTHPEARYDAFGAIRPIPDGWPQDGLQGGDDVPIDEYYVPALAALALAMLHRRDALDAKDEALANHWQNRYTQLAGG